MHIKGIGIDIVEIGRIKKIYNLYPQKFRTRIFTQEELSYCDRKSNPFPHLAVRFAAKEAVAKALGSGIRGISWKEIEVKKGEKGEVNINLGENARRLAENLGINKIMLSLSHSREYAVAQAIALNGGDKD